MGNSFISRKNFILKAAGLFALPFVASALLSCGDNTGGDSVVSQKDEYDALMESKKTFIVQEFQRTADGKILAQLPNSVFDNPNNKLGKFAVRKKIYIDGKPYMESIQVNVVSSTDTHKMVEGLNPDDVLFQNPGLVVTALAEKDRAETKKRLMHIKNLRNEGNN